MSSILPIAITILRCDGSFLFIRRRQAPYEGLWSLVGGKIRPGEHIAAAAVREILEETGAESVHGYRYQGVVSERLVDATGHLLQHFLIFVGSADIDSYSPRHREGDLRLFTRAETRARRAEFLPSDLHMFETMSGSDHDCGLYEAELVQVNGSYSLNYYRKYDG